MKPTSFYVALVRALDRRIRTLGWTMKYCDDRSGLQDGYTAKLLHPGTPSGRQARWETLQLLIDALYPAGVKVVIQAADGEMLNRLSMPDERRVVRPSDARKIDILAMSRKGGLASAKARVVKLPPALRKRVARQAARARWRRERAARRARRNAPGDPTAGHDRKSSGIP